MYFAGEVLRLSARHFCTSPSNFNKYASREGRMIQKLMTGSLKKKKNWFTAEKMGNSLPIPGKTNFHQGSRTTKRMTVLNKLFMKNITDLMATGEVAGEVLGRGISISKVKVSPDYSVVNVYWLARGTEDDVTVHKILSDAAHSLRHELSRLRVMGVVPKIEFVKDKHCAIITEVNHLLSKADFGEDFEPQDPAAIFKSEFTLSASTMPHMQPSEFDDEEPLPVMRMDVLGLNHAEIMNKISRSVKKSEAVHRRLPNVPVEDSQTVCVGMHQKSDVTKFIEKQRILKEKRRRQERKYLNARDMLAMQSAHNSVIEEYDDEDDEDYIYEAEDSRTT